MTFEYGTLTFAGAGGRFGRPAVDVELDDDGDVTVRWVEPADDYSGTSERSARFSDAEFAEIVKRWREAKSVSGGEDA